ncbi:MULTISPECIES: N-acetylglucosamine-6-phosphate deacetylase [unclassified Planococcus (in: firmicutes)]|uniref:N-acetylglucosamine-6-phosphate deacetylase n=1 Tax=unclassified Planococcus (in: firmicutes) TaxID=2662419 RepID=UPI000C34FB51|nr:MULTISPECIES: N-acetylglucosamine-6-phosphate deacetylase [unclassified Planococcus (in: firmicutes)]AUD14478.1 N-acetylglucosamine-6-phosphate deacetylase [Planococcus sp. MB-3u-03]PKG44753.1 N-acetylglucosamine-6-phosphate deacetylase [Planococcus sp. Urea-trap-24]PKG87096.1 N-acetylglucosamine-6-phosphate deacetylase [Planococcus sp. Urea-3u-39]PKH41151.1 N-acetylglucosamine-6-phosphate deacetylase [Planococcus sp. MB-3u-09]
MKNSLLVSGITIADAVEESVVGDILIEDGKISRVAEKIDVEADVHIEASGKNWTAFPGFIDVHIHGAAGHDAMDATPEALIGLAEALPKEGTTSFLATTMTQSDEAISAALENIREFQASEGQAEMLGVHLEGPFISAERAGAQPIEHIVEASYPSFREWQKKSGNQIRLVTLAPETQGAMEFIKKLTEDKVVASIGHSDATFEEVQAAVRSGASHVTHLYNQMSPFHHRKPGVVGAALMEQGLMVELIADFIHSHPASVEMAYRQKGAERLMLITDAMRAKGLPPGVYDLGGQDVQVTNKDARLADGTLAGSILTMDRAIQNVQSITGCSVNELVAMTSANAANELGLADKGKIRDGADADIAILDDDLNVQLTICRGTIAYRKE